ncbi:hypothetical protein PR048_017164 [Dryococelus australis]|uniref:Uncharacterized protein n=1 Tax=Dryococelus australis TaxID=614101 RepID=A0ABQ9H8U2_9NEOP|nr:hypothetical protein PR048_017164 [Dryococelus australis]
MESLIATRRRNCLRYRDTGWNTGIPPVRGDLQAFKRAFSTEFRPPASWLSYFLEDVLLISCAVFPTAVVAFYNSLIYMLFTASPQPASRFCNPAERNHDLLLAGPCGRRLEKQRRQERGDCGSAVTSERSWQERGIPTGVKLAVYDVTIPELSCLPTTKLHTYANPYQSLLPRPLTYDIVNHSHTRIPFLPTIAQKELVFPNTSLLKLERPFGIPSQPSKLRSSAPAAPLSPGWPGCHGDPRSALLVGPSAARGAASGEAGRRDYFPRRGLAGIISPEVAATTRRAIVVFKRDALTESAPPRRPAGDIPATRLCSRSPKMDCESALKISLLTGVKISQLSYSFEENRKIVRKNCHRRSHYEVHYSAEFINSSYFPGLSSHKLFLKVGAPSALQLKPCNITRLQVKAWQKDVIEVIVFSGYTREW